MQRTLLLSLFLITCSGLLAPGAEARIKLAAQPDRERVEIQLDNGRYTLVEEERIVPLLASTPQRGNNAIDFSWANTQIDKDSIQLRPLAVRLGGAFRPIRKEGGQPEVAVINVAYPPNENALVWEVYAKRACALKVRVSYLISNLGRTFAYRASANRAETHLTLTKYLKLRNWSGEAYDSAGIQVGFGPTFVKPLHQQTDMKILLQRFDRVPFRKTFTYDWYAHGPLNPDKPYASKVLLHYELTNDEKHALGAYPLQPGKVRIFIEDGRGGEAFLGEDWADLTPLDDEVRLYLGEARDVICTRTIQTNERHPVRGNLFHQELRVRYEIENYKDEAVTLDIIEQLNRLAAEYAAPPRGDVQWRLGTDTSAAIRITKERGGATPLLSIDAPARPVDPDTKVERIVVTLHLTLENLWN